MAMRYFIGIDVSKATLDWAVFDGKTIVLQTQSANSETGIKAALKLIKALPSFTVAESVCCLEHTGIYNAHALEFLHQKGFALWLEASLQIKQAGGLQRGKSDAIDAVRIAEYAYRFRDRIRLWQPPRPVLKQLTELSALRHRLVSVLQQLRVPLKEQKGFGNKPLQRQLNQSCQKSLQGLEADLKQVESQIQHVINEDQTLRELFLLITSVSGIGAVTATEVIISTKEMKDFKEPKQLACHAGVAPFEHRSGSSVRGRTRVNQHARKKLKVLFHLGALAAVRVKGELRNYYERKVGEGKNKMLVLNAVRNKLIHRICAVVKRGEKYNFSFSSPLLNT